MNIKEEDVQKEKGFLKNIFKSDKDKTAKLNVKFTSKDKMSADTKKMAELLPSTCFVNKSLVQFVAAYRDLAAKKLHIADFISQLPECDVLLSCFSKIMDEPDVQEAMTKVWKEDVVDKCSAKEPTAQLDHFKKNAEEFAKKLWPVFYADQIVVKSTQPLKDLTLATLRPELAKKSQRPEDMASFKPFNIKELEFDVFDSFDAQISAQV